MDETTTAAASEINVSAQDIHNAFDTLISVFDFFQGIIDKIAELIQPVFESLLDSIGYYD